MLIKCPECDLPVSDKALACPHCGFPMKKGSKPKISSRKHKRLPNGFGRIVEIKGKYLRKPFRAMISIGKDENGRPIGRLLKPESYFSTYNEAYEALMEYHKNPCNLDSSGLTVREVYNRWSKEYFKQLKSESGVRTITSVWEYCRSLEKMNIRDVRARHIKYCMDEGYVIIKNGKMKGKKRFATANTKARIKSLWNLLLDFALEYEVVDRNYARTFTLSQEIINEKEEAKRCHMSFSDSEMELLWKNTDIPYVKAILIQCYSGWRPQELCNLNVEDVNIENWTFTGGMKTASGKHRRIPIHTLIRPFVVDYLEEAVANGNRRLISCLGGTHMKNTVLTYDKYRDRFNKIKETLGLHPDHRPHDGRKQFITLAKRYGVDEYAIKRIVGHTISDITEKVYTDRDDNWLSIEIEKVKGPERTPETP